MSVIRPRTHSLHPGDLQLIFNMLFEAGGVIASEGENWIPMCLPGFNKNGYLYMFVSFLDVVDEGEEVQSRAGPALKENRIAVILISANKEGFFELRTMRNDVIEVSVCSTVAYRDLISLQDLEKTGQMNIIKSAVIQGRPTTTDIVPGTVLRHFLYKSRGNLQYVMPSFEPHYLTLFDRRRYVSAIYYTCQSISDRNTGF